MNDFDKNLLVCLNNYSKLSPKEKVYVNSARRRSEHKRIFEGSQYHVGIAELAKDVKGRENTTNGEHAGEMTELIFRMKAPDTTGTTQEFIYIDQLKSHASHFMKKHHKAANKLKRDIKRKTLDKPKEVYIDGCRYFELKAYVRNWKGDKIIYEVKL